MRELRAFRATRGARGIKNTRVVIGIDRRHGQLPGRAHRIGPLHRLHGRRGLTNGDDRKIREVTGNLGKHCQSLIISHQQLGRGIVQCISHFIRDPPSVHAHDDPADRDHPPVGKDPLGVIAQCNRHPVAGANALALQPRRKIGDQLTCLGKGPALIAVNNVLLIRIALTQHPQIPHRTRSVLVRFEGLPPMFDRCQFKKRAGCSDHRDRAAIVFHDLITHPECPSFLSVGFFSPQVSVV